jgi:hypothetical protein
MKSFVLTSFIGCAVVHCHSKRTTPSVTYECVSHSLRSRMQRATCYQHRNSPQTIRTPAVASVCMPNITLSIIRQPILLVYSNHGSQWCHLSVHACDTNTRKSVIRPSFYSYRIDDSSELHRRSQRSQCVCFLYQTHKTKTKTEASDIITNRKLAACRTTQIAWMSNHIIAQSVLTNGTSRPDKWEQQLRSRVMHDVRWLAR